MLSAMRNLKVFKSFQIQVVLSDTYQDNQHRSRAAIYGLNVADYTADRAK